MLSLRPIAILAAALALAQAASTAQAQDTDSDGILDNSDIGVNSNGYLNGIEHGHQIPFTAASGTYIVVVPALDVVSVTSGSATNVRLLVAVSGGAGKIVDPALSAISIPTSYRHDRRLRSA